MEADCCSQLVKKALVSSPTPSIFNTDQGSQFTSDTFTSISQGANIRISMGGKGLTLDNIFIERLWRMAKYERSVVHIFVLG